MISTEDIDQLPRGAVEVDGWIPMRIKKVRYAIQYPKYQQPLIRIGGATAWFKPETIDPLYKLLWQQIVERVCLARFVLRYLVKHLDADWDRVCQAVANQMSWPIHMVEQRIVRHAEFILIQCRSQKSIGKCLFYEHLLARSSASVM